MRRTWPGAPLSSSILGAGAVRDAAADAQIAPGGSQPYYRAMATFGVHVASIVAHGEHHEVLINRRCREEVSVKPAVRYG